MTNKQTNELKQVSYKFNGFTFIEIITVMLIISIATTFILVNLNRGKVQTWEIDNVAGRLVRTISLAQEQAILQPAELGLLFSKSGYSFLMFTHHGNAPQGEWWSITNNKILKFHAIPEGAEIILRIGGRTIEPVKRISKSIAPHIIFFSNGDLTPFEIDIGESAQAPRARIIGKANGAIVHQRINQQTKINSQDAS